MFNFFRKKPKFEETLHNVKLISSPEKLYLKTYKIGDIVLMDKKNKWQSYYKIIKIKNGKWGIKEEKKYTLKFSYINRIK